MKKLSTLKELNEALRIEALVQSRNDRPNKDGYINTQEDALNLRFALDPRHELEQGRIELLKYNLELSEQHLHRATALISRIEFRALLTRVTTSPHRCMSIYTYKEHDYDVCIRFYAPVWTARDGEESLILEFALAYHDFYTLE